MKSAEQQAYHSLQVQKIKEGSIVYVRPDFGNAPQRLVTVVDGLEPHKYAYAFTYTDPVDGEKWAYDHQITRVVSL